MFPDIFISLKSIYETKNKKEFYKSHYPFKLYTGHHYYAFREKKYIKRFYCTKNIMHILIT